MLNDLNEMCKTMQFMAWNGHVWTCLDLSWGFTWPSFSLMPTFISISPWKQANLPTLPSLGASTFCHLLPLVLVNKVTMTTTTTTTFCLTGQPWNSCRTQGVDNEQPRSESRYLSGHRFAFPPGGPFTKMSETCWAYCWLILHDAIYIYNAYTESVFTICVSVPMVSYRNRLS